MATQANNKGLDKAVSRQAHRKGNAWEDAREAPSIADRHGGSNAGWKLTSPFAAGPLRTRRWKYRLGRPW